MNRRDFCTKMIAAGGLIVAAPLLKACAMQSIETSSVISRPATSNELLATPSISSPTNTPEAAAKEAAAKEAAASPEMRAEIAAEQVPLQAAPVDV